FALSATTIRIVARSHLLYRFIMKRKPLLTLPARCQRLKWASEVIHQDWSSVVFTDEALVTIRDQDDRKHIAPTLRQGKKIMLWGAISYGRKYPLV
ncbi:hypothetical protein DB88DRAFT_427345, partial [Papiliotrema laurentii]